VGILAGFSPEGADAPGSSGLPDRHFKTETSARPISRTKLSSNSQRETGDYGASMLDEPTAGSLAELSERDLGALEMSVTLALTRFHSEMSPGWSNVCDGRGGESTTADPTRLRSS
jgi:hypothetical protein